MAGVLTALIATTAGCGGPTTDGDTILLSSNEFGNWQVVVLDIDSSMTYQITGDPSDAGPPSTYQVLDLSDGPVVEMVDPSWSDVDPTWSPDGEQIAVSSNRFGDFELLVLDGRGAVLDQLTDNDISDGQPSWSPQGEWIAFTSDRTGDVEIFAMRPDGTQVEQLTDSPGEDWQPAWSPDGQFLAFAAFGIGVKHEPVFVDRLQQHHAHGRAAVGGCRRQRHGVGVNGFLRLGLGQPSLEFGDRVLEFGDGHHSQMLHQWVINEALLSLPGMAWKFSRL